MSRIDPERISADFPILKRKMGGKPLVYLDSASTSQKPYHVIDAVVDCYTRYNSNIHRGIYDLSIESTQEYQRSKELAAKLVNADSWTQIIYCRNTTDAINIVSLSWGEHGIKKGDRILITDMEHHSNIVPWMVLAKKKGAVLEHAGLKNNSLVDMEDFKRKLEHRPKMVAFAHVSNVLGTINNAKEMTKLAHDAGALVLLDAAQSAPHMPLDLKAIDCDFAAFSSHKMLGPSGIGVLYGKEELLENIEPAIVGSDMIRTVTFDSTEWNDLPWKYESGTPNIEGAIGFGAALKYLGDLGMENVHDHEQRIVRYALKRLQEVDGVEIYGPGLDHLDRKAGVISFNIKGAHPHDVAQIFNSEGIAIRAGHHCAMPLVTQCLGQTAVNRMSFYIYNKQDDVDRAVDAIEKVWKVLKLKK